MELDLLAWLMNAVLDLTFKLLTSLYVLTEIITMQLPSWAELLKAWLALTIG